MSTVVIAGKEIRTEVDLHRALASALNFGSSYGDNLDALWDRLTTDVERPVESVWFDASKSREQIGAELFDRIVGLLRVVEAQDANHAYVDRLTVQILD